MKKYIIIAVAFAIVGSITGYGYFLLMDQPTVPAVMPDTHQVSASVSAQPQQLANPASVNCVQTKGGTLEIVDTPEGQQGMCHLPSGAVCEEWVLMRGTCGAE
jgi:putative hemolysin